MKKIKLALNDSNQPLVQEVKETLLKGGVVALPTETVYGLGAVAGNKAAVEKLTSLKQRSADKPFTLHYGNRESALTAFATLPPYGYRLAETFWPGPLTIVYDSVSEGKSGVRVPDHDFLSRTLNALGQPLYLPSANRSGEKEALSAAEVEACFGESLDLIVDGGEPRYFSSSTVIDITYHPFKILREGAVSVRDILDQYIRKRIVFVCTGNTCRSVMAEYLLKKYLADYDPLLLERYEIISRGTGAFCGAPASPAVIPLLNEEKACGAESHQAGQIDRYTLLSSDLIFTMEEGQRSALVSLEPTAESRIFNLKKFLPPDMEKDIFDPIGGTEQIYRDVFEIIRTAVIELRDWL